MDKLRIPLMPALVVSVMLAAAKVSVPQNAAAQQPPAQNAPKVAILVLNYPSLQGGGENVSEAMGYAVQLKKAGMEVAMIFDGPGLQWVSSVLAGDAEAGKLPEETWNPSEDEKSKIGAMLMNSMDSADVAPDEKAKISRLLIEAMISTQQRTPQQYWTPSPEEKTRLRRQQKKLREAGIPMMVAPKKMEQVLSRRKMEKAKSTETGGLDIAAYVLDGYQVWIF